MSFLILLVLTLVAGCQILGTLMVVGLMILPAAAARFLGQGAAAQLLISALLAILASCLGLLASFHFDVPTSPTTILLAGLFYLLALFVGPHGGLWHRLRGRQGVGALSFWLGGVLAAGLLIGTNNIAWAAEDTSFSQTAAANAQQIAGTQASESMDAPLQVV